METKVTKQEMDIKMVLVTCIEDIAFPDNTLGKRRTSTLQFLTPDGNYLLAERPATEEDRKLIEKNSSATVLTSEIESRLKKLEENEKKRNKMVEATGLVMCGLVRQWAADNNILSTEYEARIKKIENELKATI